MNALCQKGSFTIEAAILIPSILFFMMAVMECGIYFYQESVQRQSLEVLQKWDAVSRFYEIQLLKEIGEEIESD